MDTRDTVVELGLHLTVLEEFIKNNFPNSREKSLALTKLEECMMWSFNAIDKHGVNNGHQQA